MYPKTILITGASSGIGEAMARLFAKKGYTVTLVSRKKDALLDAQKSLPGNGHKILVADLSTYAGIQAVEKEIVATHYDVLINNAGIGVFGEFEKTTIEKYEKLVRINISAVMLLSHAYLSHATNRDALVNVASMVAFTSYPKSPVYAGSKGFVLNFTRSLSYDQSKRGVYVMALCPGITRTDWSVNAGGSPRQSFPPLLTREPDQVAHDCYRALIKRKRTIIMCGLVNTIGYYAHRFVPTDLLVNFMGKVIGGQTLEKA